MLIRLWGSRACPVVNFSVQRAVDVEEWLPGSRGGRGEGDRGQKIRPGCSEDSRYFPVPSWAWPPCVVRSLSHIREGPLPTCRTSEHSLPRPSHLSTAGKHRDAERGGQMSMVQSRMCWPQAAPATLTPEFQLEACFTYRP